MNRLPIVLAVDDDPINLRYLDEILSDTYKVYLAPSGKRALKFLEKQIPDLILLDIEMPEMDGYAVIRAIKQNPKWKDIPVVFLTGQTGRDKEQAALELGAADYILKPISIGIVKHRLGLQTEVENCKKNLEATIRQRTQELRHTQDVFLDILANMASFRDRETGAHIIRTTRYSELITENLIHLAHPGYIPTPTFSGDIAKCAKLHDIGKVAIPDNILLKPARLQDSEFEVIKHHTIYGAQMIDQAKQELGDASSFLDVAREIIISHHEKWDGSGYPYGLAGESIPLAGRIMAIADVYDALTSHRPYKAKQSHEYALSCIQQDAGTHFDPVLIELSEPVLHRFKEIALNYKDPAPVAGLA